MAEIKVDCRGQNCPVPLVETRKTLGGLRPRDVVEVTGDHPASKKEIPMAVKALGVELLRSGVRRGENGGSGQGDERADKVSIIKELPGT